MLFSAGTAFNVSSSGGSEFIKDEWNSCLVNSNMLLKGWEMRKYQNWWKERNQRKNISCLKSMERANVSENVYPTVKGSCDGKVSLVAAVHAQEVLSRKCFTIATIETTIQRRLGQEVMSREHAGSLQLHPGSLLEQLLPPNRELIKCLFNAHYHQPFLIASFWEHFATTSLTI